jgi:uncharacterized protein with GYD domain
LELIGIARRPRPGNQQGFRHTGGRGQEDRDGGGIAIKELVWTRGPYPLVAISEAPNDVVGAAFALNTAKAGYVHIQTLRLRGDRDG